MKKPEISIILPTYNERDNIVPLILAIDKYVTETKEIIVVDDNSPDNTKEVVKNLIKQNNIKNLHLKVRIKNRGLTNSIWEGILMSKGEIIIWMDCDFSHPPKIIPNLLTEIEKGYDIAVASRFIKGGKFKKNLHESSDSLLAVIFSRIMNYTVQILLNEGFKDYTSGFIAIKRKIFKKIKLQGDYGEYFMDLMMRAILLGYKFKEIPFVNLPRKSGESKTGSNLSTLLKRGIKYIFCSYSLFILKIKFKIGLIYTYDIRSQDQTFK